MRRSAWLRSTATCLNDWIRSAARLRLATSCLAASWLPAMNSSSLERRTAPSRTSSANCVAAPREARRHGQADADRIVDLVRDAGDQAAERGELLRLDQALLRVLQLAQRVLGMLLGSLELELGLPLGDGILAEHLDGAGHLADLVVRVDVVGPCAHSRPATTAIPWCSSARAADARCCGRWRGRSKMEIDTESATRRSRCRT